MYYQNYEDYMRSVLGYPIENENTYQRNTIEEMQNYMLPNQNTEELQECYPEIYKILHPMVCEVCNKCTVPVTRDIVESMVEEVYQKVEANNEILVNIQIENRDQEIESRNNYNMRMNSMRSNSNQNIRRNNPEIENRQRRPNNALLRDLIRILILNQLLGGKFPNRPPRPPRPPYLRNSFLVE